MKSKQGEVQQVFVYILSIMIVVFAGFLVVRFITTFGSDVESQTNLDFITDLEHAHKQVSQSWGQEKLLNLRVSSNVASIWFLDDSCSSLPPELELFLDTGENVLLLDDNKNPIITKDIGEFIPNGGCFEFEPVDTQVKLLIQNKRNEIFIVEQ